MPDDKLAIAIESVAAALYKLGNNDAATPMGAIEAHGLKISEASSKIADGLNNIADSIRELAQAVSDRE